MVNADWSKKFSDAHEFDMPLRGELVYKLLREMDFFNNNFDFNLEKRIPNESKYDTELTREIKRIIDSGNARTLNSQKRDVSQDGCSKIVTSNSPDMFTGWSCTPEK